VHGQGHGAGLTPQYINKQAHGNTAKDQYEYLA
jgi:hypothetical protein